MRIIYRLAFLLALIIPILGSAVLNIGVGKTDMIPPIRTPSAGYSDRNGEGMIGCS